MEAESSDSLGEDTIFDHTGVKVAKHNFHIVMEAALINMLQALIKDNLCRISSIETWAQMGDKLKNFTLMRIVATRSSTG